MSCSSAARESESSLDLARCVTSVDPTVRQEKPEANGERIVLTEGSVWFNELAQACREVFVPLGYNPPHYNMPNLLVHALAWFVPR